MLTAGQAAALIALGALLAAVSSGGAAVDAAPTVDLSARHEHERHKRDVPDILLPDVLHDGKKRSASSGAAADAADVLAAAENLRACLEQLSQDEIDRIWEPTNGFEPSRGKRLLDSLARPSSIYGKRFFDSLVRPGSIHSGRRKRFLDSLVRPGSIYGGRRKRFLDSLVRPGSIYGGRRKRFLDSLVRPGSIYNGKRSGDQWPADADVWCPVG